MFGIWESKWLDGVLLLSALALIVMIVINVNPDRDQEVFWETKIADLTGVKIAIEEVEQLSDGSLTFLNIKVFNYADFNDGSDDAFVLIPRLTSSLGRSNLHVIIDIQAPVFNYYHSGSDSNASQFFRQIRSKAYKEPFANSAPYELDIKVTDPEMLILYSRETGKKLILDEIMTQSQQYKFNIDYATLRPELKSFKLRKIKGSETKVAVKAGAYFFSKIHDLGSQPLDKFENDYRNEVESRKSRKKAYNDKRKSNNKKVKKRFEYEPDRIR